MSEFVDRFVTFVRDTYRSNDFIPLHAPIFKGNEKSYVCEAIDSTFVSSVGAYVSQFEKDILEYTGAESAVATSSGTSALHLGLICAGVKRKELVLTQALSFVATANAISYCGAEPVFLDVSQASMGLCPDEVKHFLEQHAVLEDDGKCVHKNTGKRIAAVVPMHTFGHPVQLDELVEVCQTWNLPLVEDAAESLGSFYKGKHTGTFGDYSAISFNGNKVITTGGGGMLLCNDQTNAQYAKHLSTTAKVPHSYEFFHDDVGFNYRMPNLNAALGCAQLEGLPAFIQSKRQLAESYQAFFEDTDVTFVKEPDYAKSNCWFNSVLCSDKQYRDEFLTKTNKSGVMTRPVWNLLPELPMYKNALSGALTNAYYFADRLVNIPSSVILDKR